jgi:hypothetical protein
VCNTATVLPQVVLACVSMIKLLEPGSKLPRRSSRTSPDFFLKKPLLDIREGIRPVFVKTPADVCTWYDCGSQNYVHYIHMTARFVSLICI